MTNRRVFVQSVAGLGMAAAAPQPPETDRQYWVRTLDRLAGPVLRNLAAGTLKRNMPVECVTGDPAERRRYTHLEALGRLLAGIAPWLEAPLEAGSERDLQQQYAALARQALGRLPTRAHPTSSTSTKALSRWSIVVSWHRLCCAPQTNFGPG
jgi:hypothetical protein